MREPLTIVVTKLRQTAAEYRSLAAMMSLRSDAQALLERAGECEAKAKELEAATNVGVTS